ncbi:hypothetical protein P3L10_021637 [Capsicum annuum]
MYQSCLLQENVLSAVFSATSKRQFCNLHKTFGVLGISYFTLFQVHDSANSARGFVGKWETVSPMAAADYNPSLQRPILLFI